MRRRGFLDFRMISNTPRHHGCLFTVEGVSAFPYSLAILEFDDQGLCFHKNWREILEAGLGPLEKRNPIILVFVHGWRHNAESDDENLCLFKTLLAETAKSEGVHGRPLLGVFVAWRGLSRAGNCAWEYSSFWDRQQAAERVAHGSPRELLGRLKSFRNRRRDNGGPSATLIIIGHSFGGLIVFTAIAQSLIEAASTQNRVVPSYGDLVLLVNPAFSAVSYLPIHEIVASGQQYKQDQLPVFVSVTAENDLATRDAFRIANTPRRLTEDTIGKLEHETLIRTMGHVKPLLTHKLSACQSGAHNAPAIATRCGTNPVSPFWVASASKDVIDGHDKIFLEPFQGFVRQLVAAHLRAGVAQPAAAPAPGLSPCKGEA